MFYMCMNVLGVGVNKVRVFIVGFAYQTDNKTDAFAVLEDPKLSIIVSPPFVSSEEKLEVAVEYDAV